MKGKLRITLGLAIVVATIAAFIWYVGDNPEVLRQLKQTPLYTIILMFLLFAGSMTAALMLVLYGSMSFYTKHITWQENFLLNSYSSLLNFFGPGQSGPAFRGAYLKMKHGLKIKQYIFMTLVYYAFYAFFSGMLLASTALPWWQTVSLLILITIVCCIILKLYLRRNMDLLGQNGFSHLKPALIIGGATLLQVLLLWVLYFVELRSFDNSVSLGQAATYTGAANFALFVSLTPGAIGFREAFLIFSQNLHHIPNDIIVAANILDRAVYIVFLCLLFLVVLALHANKTLQVKKIRQVTKQET
jgi:uncharacterized membrane protein YbhN (UPF0104 family)